MKVVMLYNYYKKVLCHSVRKLRRKTWQFSQLDRPFTLFWGCFSVRSAPWHLARRDEIIVHSWNTTLGFVVSSSYILSVHDDRILSNMGWWVHESWIINRRRDFRENIQAALGWSFRTCIRESRENPLRRAVLRKYHSIIIPFGRSYSFNWPIFIGKKVLCSLAA